VKTVADTRGARSNLAERLRRPGRAERGPYRRKGDDALLTAIRAITDSRPTYGYRRVAAVLNRARRSSGRARLAGLQPRGTVLGQAGGALPHAATRGMEALEAELPSALRAIAPGNAQGWSPFLSRNLRQRTSDIALAAFIAFWF
jgi:hypothetical protein